MVVHGVGSTSAGGLCADEQVGFAEPVGGVIAYEDISISGVDFDTALKAVDELRPLVPSGATMAQFALKWILTFEAVSCVIPGAKRPEQLDDNVAAAELATLPVGTMEHSKSIYDRLVRPLVHQRW